MLSDVKESDNLMLTRLTPVATLVSSLEPTESCITYPEM